MLISTPIQGELDDIQLVKRRILLAGAAALLAALALGFTAASLHVRRIRRLERAADRIAHGEFGEPVVDRGSDELTDLANAFEHMRRRLAALDDARREFVANASHELRTPIFALGAALELLEDEELDAETRDEFLETMRDQVARLTRMTADLLDLTRMDAGRMPVEAEPVDLHDSRRGARPGVRRRRPCGRPHARGGDERRGDARSRTPTRCCASAAPWSRTRSCTRRRGRAFASSRARSERRVALEVADDGPGVPAEQGERIFERFYRGEGTRASGSGLGLAIAHELAELMHGELALDGRAGRASRSCFRLIRAPKRFHGKTARRATLGPCARSPCTVIALGAAIVGGAIVYLLGAARDDSASTRPGRSLSARSTRPDAASAPLPARSGFDPERIYAVRAPGVVTLYTYFGGAPPAEHAAQGSGFVVSPDGYILTSAHVITTAGQGTAAPVHGAQTSTWPSPTATGSRRRWSAGTSSTTWASSASIPATTRSARSRSRTRRAARRRFGRRDRQPVRQPRLAERRRRLRRRPLDPLADLRLLRLRRDPDRRPDHARQLGRPADRRLG